MKTGVVTCGLWSLEFEVDGLRPLPLVYTRVGDFMARQFMPPEKVREELFTRALKYCTGQLEERTT